jgi:hypothetical protein
MRAINVWKFRGLSYFDLKRHVDLGRNGSDFQHQENYKMARNSYIETILPHFFLHPKPCPSLHL